MRFVVLVVLSIFLCTRAFAHLEGAVTPWAPTASDVILVNVYLDPVTIASQSYSVSGSTVNVVINNNGYDFLPSPPGPSFTRVGPLPAGSYTFNVSVIGPGAGMSTFPMVVTAAPTATLLAVVEFYNASQNHYFLTSDAVEMHDLDVGVHPGWTRTGYSFQANANATGGDSPVCRFYVPPKFGDSHYFSVFEGECVYIPFSVYLGYPAFYTGYVQESPNIFYMGVPDVNTGACSSGHVPVYRLWNNKPDSNHRYTTDAKVKAQMVAQGWIPEGYGPDAVAMCAPT